MQRGVKGYVVTQVYKFLSKDIDDLGKTICARVCNGCNEIADLRDS